MSAQIVNNREIVEDLLKLVYSYQDLYTHLGIVGEQSPSVLRAEDWLSIERKRESGKCLHCDHGIEYLGTKSAAVCRFCHGFGEVQS